MSLSAAEVASLEQKINEFKKSETKLQENIKQLKDENNEISNSLKIVNSEKISMESHIKDLVTQLTALQTDNKSKEEMVMFFKKEAADMKESYNVRSFYSIIFCKSHFFKYFCCMYMCIKYFLL